MDKIEFFFQLYFVEAKKIEDVLTPWQLWAYNQAMLLAFYRGNNYGQW